MSRFWKYTGALAAVALLIAAFGVLPQPTAVAQSATLTVIPVSSTDVATQNINICAKCGGDDARFTITVTDSDQNDSATVLDTVTVTVKNAELGTLGTATTPDSNPKTITLLETGVNTGIFTRVAKAVNLTSALVSDKITGTADAGSDANTLEDAALNDATLRAADLAALVGGEVLIDTTTDAGAPVGTSQTISAEDDGEITVDAAFAAAITAGDTFTVLLANPGIPTFSGQTITVSYSQAGSLGQSKSLVNDEVKPTIVITSPAQDLITKKAKTIVFQADITDTGAGFPAKAQDIVDNNGTGAKGRIQLYVGTTSVALTSASFTAITDGWRLSASFSSTDIHSIAPKVAWWIEAEDLAGNAQQPSEGAVGTTSATGADGTTITDSALIGMAANSLVGRTVTVSIAGVAETRTVDAYATATGVLRFDDAPATTTTADDDFSAAIAASTEYTIKKTLLITVDGTKPSLSAVVTGDRWSAASAAGARLKSTTSTVAAGSTTSMRVTFTDASGLDSATVLPAAFVVSSNTVSSVLLVDVVGENALSAEQRLPLDVFLTLGTALTSSTRPTVTISSSILDKAGNAFAGASSKATDKLGPSLTVTLDKTLSKKQVKATIVSDELLIAAPTVAVLKMTSTTTGAVGAVAGSAVGAVAQSGTMTYTQTTKIASIGNDAGAEFNVYVTANDTGASGGNLGKKGHASNATHSTAITYELDQWLNDGNPPKVLVADEVAEATTASATGVPKVESVDPLIVTVDFNKGCTAGDACAAAGETAEYTGDSHKTAKLTKATYKVTFKDGSSETTTLDVASDITSPDNKRFTIALQAPKVGKYTLTINAVDEAGNDNLTSPTAATPQNLVYNWEVTAASPVKLSLSPGWNLMSLPFQPANPAINSVIPATHPIDLVMAYNNTDQVWLVSRRDADTGLFVGDVAVMTATTAYFVRTNNFEELSLLQPPVATQAAAPPPPPAIAIVAGWNLVPVVTFTPSTTKGIAADSYLGTLGKNWLKAMTYDPLTRTWDSITPLATVQQSSGATNACTGKALAAAAVLANTEPCQSATYTNVVTAAETAAAVAAGVAAEAAAAGSGAAAQAAAEAAELVAFDDGDTVVMKKAVLMGRGYWVYSSAAGVVIP